MNDTWLIRAPIALVPVLLFLGALVHGDSYKLLRFKTVLMIAAAGALAAGASYVANVSAFAHFAGDLQAYSRYISPWIEESLKAVVLVFLFVRGASVAGGRRHRRIRDRHRLRAGREPCTIWRRGPKPRWRCR